MKLHLVSHLCLCIISPLLCQVLCHTYHIADGLFAHKIMLLSLLYVDKLYFIGNFIVMRSTHSLLICCFLV